MAQLIYKPKFSIDKINANFSKISSQDTLSTFINNNFDTINTAVTNTNNGTPIPFDMNLVNRIYVDYGDGPVGDAMKQALTLINENVLAGDFTSYGDIFGNIIVYGANTDFRYVTLSQGNEIVMQNLMLYTLLPYISDNLKTPLNNTVDLIVNDIKNGTYDYNNYLITVLGQTRIIAKELINKYG